MQLGIACGNWSGMPYSFSTRHTTLAAELGTLRKLAKARRLAAAGSVNRMRHRPDTSSDAAREEGPPPTRIERKRRDRLPS
ncbi:MAG: hypothetical protein K2X72_12155 [Reyranella sp.]|nr:hypothetical protein [Reyranella sp.]